MEGVPKVNNAAEHKVTQTTGTERSLDSGLEEIWSLVKIFLVIKIECIMSSDFRSFVNWL